MKNLINEVHLFVALDPQLSPGPVLQALDYFRVKEWQQETVLICDARWKQFVNIDQPAIFLNKSDFYQKQSFQAGLVNTETLDQLLEQLDSFQITHVTQIGSLAWGRWLQAYLEAVPDVEYVHIESQKIKSPSIGLLNDLSHKLGIDLSVPLSEKSTSSAVYLDPYDGEFLSETFVELLKQRGSVPLPEWLNIISKEADQSQLIKLGIEEHIVDFDDMEVTLFNQKILCFSDQSQFAQTSRSYNVALFSCQPDCSLFFQGDISISTKESVHLSELINILAYWKAGRLKELAFQWFDMGIEISIVEFFHNHLVKRSLLNYSADLYNCQIILSQFLKESSQQTSREIAQLIHSMRAHVSNDPYSLSFSLKILIMIAERMLASASCGERLFQRLGSDYHRIFIGEALIEGIIEKNKKMISEIDIKQQLTSFLKFLVRIDFQNDQSEPEFQTKDS